MIEIEEQVIGNKAFIQLHSVRMDLEKLGQLVEQVLVDYGVSRVLRTHHDGRFPLYELQFTSEHTLEFFLQYKHEAEELVLSSIYASMKTTVTPPMPSLHLRSQLYLVVPARKYRQVAELVTADNYKQFLPKVRESLMYKFQPSIFNKTEG